MTVRELINKLLDRPMDDDVLLCYDKEHIDEQGMRYKCIKGFSVDKYDDNGFPIENEYENIEVGSVWETSDTANMMAGGLEHIHLENIKDGSWLEIPKEQIDEYFKQIKPLYDKGLKPLKQYY